MKGKFDKIKIGQAAEVRTKPSSKIESTNLSLKQTHWTPKFYIWKYSQHQLRIK